MPMRFDDDIMSAIYNIMVIFPINAQFGATQKSNLGHMVHNSKFSNNKDFSFNKR